MKKKTRTWRIAVLLLSLFCLSGCMRTGEAKQETDQKSDGKIRIGISFDTFVLERWQRDRDVFVAAAQELGAEVNVQNANGDIEEQAKQLNYFTDKGMDVIVLVQVASDTNQELIRESIERAKKAGIPVVAYDRLVKNAGVDLYISFDNRKVGELMAEHMKEHLGDSGKILQICGPLADYNVPQMMEGFSSVLNATDLEIAETDYAPGWLGETGFSVTETYLDKNGRPSGIMCGNDGIAGNAVKALSERRMAGKVCIVGQDADLDACQRIVEGTQCMTVYKPVEQLARRAAELSVALAKKENLPVTENMYDGSQDVLYERLEPISVTKENMDAVITGKYHEESDIYRNVRRSRK